jgi:hypothetical protein
MKRSPTLAASWVALALVAGPARASDPEPDTPEPQAPAEDRAPWEISGRLRANLLLRFVPPPAHETPAIPK